MASAAAAAAHRDRGGDRDRKHEARGHEGKQQHDRPHGEPRSSASQPSSHAPSSHAPSSHAPSSAPSSEPRGSGLVEALLEVLRGSDGRPMHVRQLADAAVKRRALDDKGGQPADLVRVVRAALLREQRDRDADGLRPRIRGLGGGNFATPDRKLDPELVQAERDLAGAPPACATRPRPPCAAASAACRRPPSTRSAARSPTSSASPGSSCSVAARASTYWGGTRPAGVGTVRTLIAFRAGEGEVNRRAVGELRAGLAAKGYDEGLLFSARPPQRRGDRRAQEPAASRSTTAAALAALVVKHGLGVRRVTMPVDYLDVDFFFELQEG